MRKSNPPRSVCGPRSTNGKTSSSACKPNSTTTASARSRRRWIWCGRDVLLAMLPVHDDIVRAVAAMEKSDDIQALRSGVVLIAQKFTEALRQKGVTAIEVTGKEFDPETSEAVARFAAGEEMKGRVVDTVQTGYLLGDKVLRFAKVVVGE